jgi:hypothetical protein
MDLLKRAAAHLDSVTLDRVWQAALRGDMEVVHEALEPYLKDREVSSSATSWRESSSWLFDRPAYDRDR